MGKIFAYASGKGGAGKTTMCALTGFAMANMSKKTLIIELDSGLRGLDVMLGIFDKAVNDLSDGISGRCKPIDCCYRSNVNANLFAVTAPVDGDFRPTPQELTSFISSVQDSFDAVFIDCPAGIGSVVVTGCKCADTAVILTIPETICIRDASVLSQKLWAENITEQRLIINMVKKKGQKFNQVTNFDWVIDQTGVQLIGVVPFERKITDIMKKDIDFSLADFTSVNNIAKRLLDQYVPLSIR